MALTSSGQITLNEIHVEAGGSSGSQVALSDTDVKDLVGADNNNTALSDYYGAAAANTTSSIAGGGSTTTNGFANCNVSLSSGNKLVVVIAMYRVQSGSAISNGPSSVTVGGQSATLRNINNKNVAASGYGHINSIWVLETTLSGTQLVTGSTMTGTGNNSCIVYEVTGHTTATPRHIAVASNYTGTAATSDIVTLIGASGGTALFGCTATSSGNSGTISTSPSTTVSQNSFSNLNHASARLDGTSAGSTAYTFTNTQSGFFNIVAASFK